MGEGTRCHVQSINQWLSNFQKYNYVEIREFDFIIYCKNVNLMIVTPIEKEKISVDIQILEGSWIKGLCFDFMENFDDFISVHEPRTTNPRKI